MRIHMVNLPGTGNGHNTGIAVYGFKLGKSPFCCGLQSHSIRNPGSNFYRQSGTHNILTYTRAGDPGKFVGIVARDGCRIAHPARDFETFSTC